MEWYAITLMVFVSVCAYVGIAVGVVRMVYRRLDNTEDQELRQVLSGLIGIFWPVTPMLALLIGTAFCVSYCFYTIAMNTPKVAMALLPILTLGFVTFKED